MKSSPLVLGILMTLLLAGCGGGGAVGENSPTYSLPALLKEGTQTVVFTGEVAYKDEQSEVVLTINGIGVQANPEFTISFKNKEEHTTGVFREISNRSLIVSCDPVTIKVDGVDCTFTFEPQSRPTTLVYSGDPSEGDIPLIHPASGICKLGWSETIAATGDQPETTVSYSNRVEFKKLRIK